MNSFEIAKAFNVARKSGNFLPDYPTSIPEKMANSYEIQEEAIKLWDSEIIGWKIGRLPPEKQELHATERLTGPIFKEFLQFSKDGTADCKVFIGGFAAVEAEYVFEIKADTLASKTSYTEDEAFEIISAVYAGIEMAGSPLATINKLGPTVVASDFGNNYGLILGEKLLDFSGLDKDSLSSEAVKSFKVSTEIEGQTVGTGGLFSMPNGPLAAIAWLAGHLAERGRPLKKGQYISSGASTGIHDIEKGQSSSVYFDGPNIKHTINIRTV